MKGCWLLPAAWVFMSTQAVAREDPVVGPDATDQGEIIVTATQRNAALSTVPLAISAITADSLRNSGVRDIRQLNQLSPSLLVASTQSEAAAGVARIRGVGTVGDNPGLESSVAIFVDGVYRSRTGLALTELGSVDRIEVLRGPQGSLFGRNASAGLIHVITTKPSFTAGGNAEFGYGNYNQYRAQIGLTGPITDTIAYRIDGVWTKRDGFMKDVISGRDLNNRNRWLARGQLLFTPGEDLSIRIIGDYARRREECCAAVYLPANNASRAADGSIVLSPSTILGLERALGAHISDDPFARRTSLTPGLGYGSRVRDRGLSGQIDYDFGAAKLTSITAWRDWRYVRGQDSDFNDLDLVGRAYDGGNRQRFRTFTQELRLQGRAFGDRLDFLVGGYYANEQLGLHDNLGYGKDYQAYANCLLAANVGGQLGAADLASPGGVNCFSQPIAGAIAANPAVPAQVRQTVALLGGLVPGIPVGGYNAIAAALGAPGLGLTGVHENDSFHQTSRNYAFFTHDVVKLTDQLNLTLGARYTHERKTLDASLTDNNDLCRAIAASPFASLALPTCGAVPATATGAFAGTARKAESEWSGTAALSFRPTPRLLTYVSYSKGYKAGGFDLDRTNLPRTVGGTGPISPAALLDDLKFAPEKVDAIEAGLKYSRPGFDLNIAAFREIFGNFQLNAFNGLSFDVVNISACKSVLTADGACPGKARGGVNSQGVEAEAFIRPMRALTLNLGLTYADTRYRRNLVGARGEALSPALFQLPGRRLTSAPAWVATGGAGWAPALGHGGLTGLLYGDIRYQSGINTGADLDQEKLQGGVATVNARIGVHGPDNRWALEFWGQNIFDADYIQVAFDSPLQGQGSIRTTQANGTTSTGVFNAFLAEPRTYGVTVRTVF